MKKTQRKQQQIKMVAFNEITREWNDVYPEDEVAASEMLPMFWDNYAKRFVTVPDTTVEETYEAWIKELAK